MSVRAKQARKLGCDLTECNQWAICGSLCERRKAGTSLQQHPAYHQGFYDAQDGEPIWQEECAREYAAGWRAFWECREIATALSASERKEGGT